MEVDKTPLRIALREAALAQADFEGFDTIPARKQRAEADRGRFLALSNAFSAASAEAD